MIVQSQLQTEIGEHIERLVPYDEEQNPTPWCPSPGMLVARVTERLAQAAFGIKLYYDVEGEEERDKLFEICVFFIGAAAIAINVIPHIHPDADEAEPTEFKDVLVTELDKRLSEMIDESPQLFEDNGPDEWLRFVLSLMTGACQSVCEVEHAIRPVVGAREWDDDDDDGPITRYYGLDEDDDEEEDEDEAEREEIDKLRTAIADSLFATAVTAAAAGQWFLDQHERWEDEGAYEAELPGTGEGPSEDTVDVEDDVLTDCVMEHKLMEGLLWGEPADLSDWDSDERWSYRESSASTSRRNHSRLSIAICDTPNAFARRLPLSPTRPS